MATWHEKAEFNTVSYGLSHFFAIYSRNTYFFEKYVTCQNWRTLNSRSKEYTFTKFGWSERSYVYKYNSILWAFRVFHCISSIYHLINHFFEEYIRIKIEEHKILILTSIPSPNLAEVNASYTYKYNSILFDIVPKFSAICPLHTFYHFPFISGYRIESDLVSSRHQKEIHQNFLLHSHNDEYWPSVYFPHKIVVQFLY